MNKLISKIVGVALGLTLAAGTGVAIATNAKTQKASVVEAAESTAYTLTAVSTGGNTSPHNSYTAAATTTVDGVEWSVTGNSNMVPWRLGGKSISNVSRTVQSNAVVSTQNITKVVLTTGASSGSITVNSLTLKVGTAAGGSQTSSVSGTYAASSSITFNRPTGADWTGKYFTFDFVLTVSGSSNKYVSFDTATFYYEAGGSIDDVTISGTTTVSSGYLGLTTTQLTATVDQTGGLDETVEWSSSNSSVAAVDENGAVRFLANGSANITATSTADSTVSDTVTVTASNLTTYSGLTDTGDFTDTSTWGSTTISDFSGTLTNISFADGGSASTKLAYNKDGNMRVYNGTVMTLTCSSAYSIEYVVATCETGNAFSKAPTSSEGNGYLFGLDWLVDCSANGGQSVSIAYGGTTAYIDTLVVYYSSTGSYGISVNNAVSSLTRGATGTFTATASGATNPSIAWSSSSSNVISIDASTGAYSADFVGTTTITATLTCNEGTDTASFDVTVSGNVTIAEANSICAGLAQGDQTSYKVTIENYVIDLNPNNKAEGSENQIILADYKVGGSGNSILVHGITNSFNVGGKSFRAQAVLNGTAKVTGYLKNYSGTYEVVSPTLNTYSDDAMTFAKSSYESLQEACNAGPESVTDAQWNALATAWASVDSYSKTKLQNATSSYEYNTDIAHWIDRYTRIVQSGKSDFMNLGLSNGARAIIGLSGSENATMILVVFVGIIATTTGAYFFLRKKKEQ